MTIWRWAGMIDAPPAEARLSLGEGNTPVVRCRRIGRNASLPNLWLKLETTNPSGSYKDRFAVGAVSHMVAAGQTRAIATSSGNTGSALAAYCAAAGIACEIAVVESAPQAKLLQMGAYGAEIYRVRGFGLDEQITNETFEALRRLAAQPGAALQISAFRYSPLGMSGVQTIGFELAEQFSQPIDHVFCPAGGGGLVLAVARAFERFVQDGKLARSPAVECVQPEGNDTIAGPLREGLDRCRAIRCTSQISGLQVPSVIDGDEALAACRRSGGTGHLVTDEAVWAAQARLAREEGIFSEPAGATALAGALQAAEEGRIARDATVVCLVTGTGFKDSPSLEQMASQHGCPTIELDALKARAARA